MKKSMFDYMAEGNKKQPSKRQVDTQVRLRQELDNKARELTRNHLTDNFGNPDEHWCYDNVYKAILFTLIELGWEAT